MNTATKIEKIVSGKKRKEWDEEVIKKGAKLNKTQRNREAKRNWE